MTLWKNLVVALVAAFALAACSSSDNGSGTDMTKVTPEEACTDAGGRWNTDMTCTSAGDLAAERVASQRTAIRNAITAATNAVAMVTNDATEAQVTAAETAIAAAEKAIADATNVPAAEKSANNETVSAIVTTLANAKASRTAAINAATEDLRVEMAAAGKALQDAIGTNPRTNIATADLGTSPATLQIDPGARGTPAVDAPSVNLMIGDSAGSLGKWRGTNYARTDAGTGVSDAAIVYTNKDAPKTYAPAARYTGSNATDNLGTVGATAYSADTRTFTLGADADQDIAGPMFPTAGSQNYPNDEITGVVTLTGSYQGASGSYRCSGGTNGTPCTASVNATGATTLAGGTWVFIHAAGAMVSVADANYLAFGWWLRKDKDGEPTNAGAFTDTFGTVATSVDLTTIAGSATYVGKAAGKFAINDPINGGDAGHFTADATLTAKFGANADPNNGGVSGTLDNFMANDKSVSWSVELQRAQWGNSGSFASIPDDTATEPDEETATVWSIDGNAAAKDGSWSGQMYDEMPGNAPDGDGSDVPTSVTATFNSNFGSTHSMIGALGAEKQ